MPKRLFLTAIVGCLAAMGCNDVDTNPNKGNMTLGAVQMKVENGKTTKAQILEWFGAPNVATKDKDGEIWNYTRQGNSNQIRSSSVGVWFLIGAGDTGKSSSRSGSYSFDLLLRFDKADIVQDHKVLQTAF